MDTSFRYHEAYPNIPLRRANVTVADAAKGFICDVSGQRVQPGDVLWSNREHDVDILDQAMPMHDIRFHLNFPQVPLTRKILTAEDIGKWTCDVTDRQGMPGDVMWGNRERDIDVLDAAFQSALPMPSAAPDPGHSQVPRAAMPGGGSNAVEGLNQMGVELLHAILLKKDPDAPNIFVSPLSIGLALGMTANGARGETLDGMMSALCAQGLGGLEPLNVQLQPLASALSSADPRVTFHLANSLWSQVLSDSFVSICASVYGAEARRGAPQPAPINQWCAKQTRDKIKEVLDPACPLDPGGAVLVNALYFKGEWKVKFDERFTKASTFFGASGGGSGCPCQMMTAKAEKDKFLYAETDTHQVAALPYGDGGEYSAVIILPRKDSSQTLTMRGAPLPPGAATSPRAATLDEVLVSAVTTWPALTVAFAHGATKGTLEIPRFKVEFGTDLTPLLQARGMEVAFTSAADFSAMSDAGLAIQKVIHKTFVEVNEQGTEAAAVTAVVMSRCLPAPEPFFRMVCDVPFLFFIRHDRTNAMVFAGVVADIKE